MKLSLLLSVVIPTWNERENIAMLLERVVLQLDALAGQYEIIVVDDNSPDNTAAVVEDFRIGHPAVTLLRRSGVRDLSTAIAAGFDAASGDYVVAMDADLQHDPAEIVRLLSIARDTAVDLVVATRYADGGATVDWHPLRGLLSHAATLLARMRLQRNISDPLSGFFLLRREEWNRLRPQLHLSGFKLLLEILAADPALRCAETGYRFVARQQGSSKFSIGVAWAFARALCRLRRQR